MCEVEKTTKTNFRSPKYILHHLVTSVHLFDLKSTSNNADQANNNYPSNSFGKGFDNGRRYNITKFIIVNELIQNKFISIDK